MREENDKKSLEMYKEFKERCQKELNEQEEIFKIDDDEDLLPTDYWFQMDESDVEMKEFKKSIRLQQDGIVQMEEIMAIQYVNIYLLLLINSSVVLKRDQPTKIHT